MAIVPSLLELCALRALHKDVQDRLDSTLDENTRSKVTRVARECGMKLKIEKGYMKGPRRRRPVVLLYFALRKATFALQVSHCISWERILLNNAYDYMHAHRDPPATCGSDSDVANGWPAIRECFMAMGGTDVERARDFHASRAHVLAHRLSAKHPNAGGLSLVTRATRPFHERHTSRPMSWWWRFMSRKNRSRRQGLEGAVTREKKPEMSRAWRMGHDLAWQL